MKTKLALLATTTLAALAIATPANAASGGWYVNLSGGANWLNDNDFATIVPDTFAINTESDTGYVISGAIGFSLGQMMQGLRVEAEVGYQQNQVDGLWTAVPAAVIGDTTGTLDYDHTTLSVLANVWYDFDVGGVKPYIGGGIGWADVEADGNFVDSTPPVVPFSVSEDGFAWQVGAGVNFTVAPNVSLGVGYRYFHGPDVSLPATFLDPLNLASGDIESNNHSAVVTLTFGM